MSLLRQIYRDNIEGIDFHILTVSGPLELLSRQRNELLNVNVQ